MKTTPLVCLAFLATVSMLALSSDSHAQPLWLDFQPTGGTTAAGYQAFEATNQVIPTSGTSYSAFGTTVTVSLDTANLPDANLDFRSVARNGAADDVANDWIGADTRNGGVDVTLAINVAGLPAGDYNWLSIHHDGGAGATNGNLSGMPDYTFADANGSMTGILMESSQNDGDPVATFSKSFTSDGVSPVSLTMVMDNGQGDSPGTALFAFINSVQITQVPEPNTAMLTVVAMAMAALSRRRK
ncbi:MAG: PEP-CTERM sorting domain-containing protein [Pirellulaceae bacterium]|nr:PEP-CTERM sorting domain-containing protein [Planctomycetales bacterium]